MRDRHDLDARVARGRGEDERKPAVPADSVRCAPATAQLGRTGRACGFHSSSGSARITAATAYGGRDTAARRGEKKLSRRSTSGSYELAARRARASGQTAVQKAEEEPIGGLDRATCSAGSRAA